MSRPAAGVTPQKAPKIMSSRLANMKFMQRATNTPLPQSPATPASDRGSVTKRVKTSDSQAGSPGQPHVSNTPSGLSSQTLGATGVETMWTLDWSGSNDHSHIELDEPNMDDGPAPWMDTGESSRGRLQFGGFKKKLPVQPDDQDESDASKEDGNSDGEVTSDDDEATQVAKQNLARVREARAKKAKTERDKSRKVVGERKKKDVKLNPRSGGRQGISAGRT